jgi:hypothetical protein
MCDTHTKNYIKNNALGRETSRAFTTFRIRKYNKFLTKDHFLTNSEQIQPLFYASKNGQFVYFHLVCQSTDKRF